MSPPPRSIRVDIQLLRAAAVLAVIAFHFWPSRVVSGFAGVDVFFVVSGFLITSLIIREIESTGKLNLVGFWIRRVRRILPASIVVIAATAGTVLWIGSPDMLTSIGRHVFASTFSGENIRLALDQADYSNSAEAPSPLQHFWSLAIEEQFYLVWPLVVLLFVAPPPPLILAKSAAAHDRHRDHRRGERRVRHRSHCGERTERLL